MSRESNVNETRKKLYADLERKVGKQYLEEVYLTPRDTMVPTYMRNVALAGVRDLFLNLFESISTLAEEVLTKGGQQPNIKAVVQPSCEGNSYIAILSERKETVLFRTQANAKKFIFEKEELMDYMFDVFQTICLSYFDMVCDDIVHIHNTSSKNWGVSIGS